MPQGVPSDTIDVESLSPFWGGRQSHNSPLQYPFHSVFVHASVPHPLSQEAVEVMVVVAEGDDRWTNVGFQIQVPTNL